MLGEVLESQKTHKKDYRLEGLEDPGRYRDRREKEGLVDLCQNLLLPQVWETRE